jgi:hypothetical protein
VSANTEGLLNKLPTVATCLCREARVDSDDLMTSSLSLIFKDLEKHPPTGVHDALSEVMILHHVVYRKFLDSNMVIVFGVRIGDFVVEITALTGDLQMRLSCITSRLPSSVRSLLPTAQLTLFAPQGALRRTIKARVVYGVAITISQEGLQAHINADIRMRAGRGDRRGRWFRLAHDESVPMPIGTMDKVNGLGCPFEGTMQLDFEEVPQLLGNDEVLLVLMQVRIFPILSQLDGVPAIRLLKTWESHISNAQLFSREEAFERLGEAICKHLDGGGGDMFATTALKPCRQIVLGGERTLLCILLLDHLKHLIIQDTRLTQALHEQTMLFFLHKKAILKRSHREMLIYEISIVKREVRLRRRPFTPMHERRGPQAAIGRQMNGSADAEIHPTKKAEV